MESKEIARLLGVSHRMVNRLKSQGMPTNSIEAATEWRRKNLHPVMTKQMRIDGNTGVKAGLAVSNKDNRSLEELQATVTGASQLDLETGDADELYKNSRALKEKALSLQAAAEHEKFIGSLVELAYVEKIIFERARQFRDGLMSLSRRLAPAIVGCDSIPEAEKLLNDEYRSILEEFAKLPVIEK